MTTETMKLAILTGDTYQVRDSLKSGGWKWDADGKAWVKLVPADADEALVERCIRMLSGVRNRMGKVAIKFERE